MEIKATMVMKIMTKDMIILAIKFTAAMILEIKEMVVFAAIRVTRVLTTTVGTITTGKRNSEIETTGTLAEN